MKERTQDCKHLYQVCNLYQQYSTVAPNTMPLYLQYLDRETNGDLFQDLGDRSEVQYCIRNTDIESEEFCVEGHQHWYNNYTLFS